jgi:hypothetical protein
MIRRIVSGPAHEINSASERRQKPRLTLGNHERKITSNCTLGMRTSSQRSMDAGPITRTGQN